MLGGNDELEIYQDALGQWRWKRTAPNGKIIGASTEGYWNKEDCVANATRTGNDVWDFYMNRLSQWRWQRVAPNRKIVGASTEGYWNKEDCVNNAVRNGY